MVYNIYCIATVMPLFINYEDIVEYIAVYNYIYIKYCLNSIAVVIAFQSRSLH